jgi:hypothetical protein
VELPYYLRVDAVLHNSFLPVNKISSFLNILKTVKKRPRSDSDLPMPDSWRRDPDLIHTTFIRILQDLADDGADLADKWSVSKLLEQRIRYYAKLSPAKSGVPEEQFAKRYEKGLEQIFICFCRTW